MELSQKTTLICPLCRTENNARFAGLKLNGQQGLFPKRDYTNAAKVYCCFKCGLYFNYPAPVNQKEIFDEDDSLVKFTLLDPERLKAEAGCKDILDFLENTARMAKGSKLLDMGSGTGITAYALREAGYKVYAVEPKKELFDFSVENGFTDRDKSSHASFETTAFVAESFDFIFLEPLNHFKNPDAAIQKTLQWLKPGGYLHLEVTNSRWLYKIALAFLYRITFRKHVPYTSALRKPFTCCEYSALSFKVYAKMTNLNLCVLESYPCNTFISNKFLSRLMSFYMKLSKQGMELSIVLQKKEFT
ncbi:hypothetical protein CNR22_10100 [Sphingobacteriaceae bacterium]|nr:hypothetical protein CNR22_10100 [Sphingobacteriaceae bacterium]